MLTIGFWIVFLVGAAVIVCAVIGLLAAGVGSLLEWKASPHQRSFNEGFQQARHILGQDSYWFSEDDVTMQLLADLGKGTSVSDARDRWRQSRAKAAAAESAA